MAVVELFVIDADEIGDFLGAGHGRVHGPADLAFFQEKIGGLSYGVLVLKSAEAA